MKNELLNKIDMLEIRPNCENCGKDLPNGSTEAMICTIECTFCSDCVENVLHNVCPNCGGGFEKRPIRPKQYTIKYPPKVERYFAPVNMTEFHSLLIRNKAVEPGKR